MRKVVIAMALLILTGAAPRVAEPEDLSTQMMRATVKVANAKSNGTGFVLTLPGADATKKARLVLVTAGHVFERMTGNEASAFFRVREAEGVYKKVPLKLTIRQDNKPLWTKHPTEDVAALYVEPPAGADVPRLSTDLLATDEALKKYAITTGDKLRFVGYPHMMEANGAGFAILRSGPIASFPLRPVKVNKTFMVSANTFEGDSGSPVFLADSRKAAGKSAPEEVRLILGLVTQNYSFKEETRMTYRTTSTRYLLGLAVVLQARFIAETLERLPKQANEK